MRGSSNQNRVNQSSCDPISNNDFASVSNEPPSSSLTTQTEIDDSSSKDEDWDKLNDIKTEAFSSREENVRNSNSLNETTSSWLRTGISSWISGLVRDGISFFQSSSSDKSILSILIDDLNHYTHLVEQHEEELSHINRALDDCRNEFERAIGEQQLKSERIRSSTAGANSYALEKQNVIYSVIDPVRLKIYNALVSALRNYPNLSGSARDLTSAEVRRTMDERAAHHEKVRDLADLLLGESYAYVSSIQN